MAANFSPSSLGSAPASIRFQSDAQPSRRLKIIVLDDDPTGSQTVHGCLLLLTWEVEQLQQALQDDSPLLFILTNTRALPPQEALAVTRAVCENLKTAIAQLDLRDYLIVSRSDSTLRGHYPLETDAIAEILGPFDAHFLTPAFFEGGRLTRQGIHYLLVDGVPTPVHQTEFARDSVFGYDHSFLPDYVAQKTQGRIPANQVVSLDLTQIRSGCLDTLLGLRGNVCVVVDGDRPEDFDQFAEAVLTAVGQGKRFLFRSAASLLTSLAQLPPQPIAPLQMAQYRRSDRPGVILVGSHVQKTTQQLQRLLTEPEVGPIEIPVDRLQGAAIAGGNSGGNSGAEPSEPAFLEEVLATLQGHYEAGRTPVLYTSRQELQFPDIQTRLQFGVRVSRFLMDIIQNLPPDLSFLISKGGITSNDTLSTGLALTQARLLGQVLPGVSVVRTDAHHPRYPNLPVVLFPGNVGAVDALAIAFRRFQEL